MNRMEEKKITIKCLSALLYILTWIVRKCIWAHEFFIYYFPFVFFFAFFILYIKRLDKLNFTLTLFLFIYLNVNSSTKNTIWKNLYQRKYGYVMLRRCFYTIKIFKKNKNDLYQGFCEVFFYCLEHILALT